MGKELQPDRGRGGKYNWPSSRPPDNADDVRRILTDVMACYDAGNNRPTSDEGIAERVQWFFNYSRDSGTFPTVEKLCLALGYARNTVNEWKNGKHCSAERSNIIKRAYDIISAYDAARAIDGDMDRTVYIFRGKNYYGMTDQQEIVVAPRDALAAGNDTAEEIAAKYADPLALPGE